MTNKKVFFFLPFLAEGGGERVASDLSLNFPQEVTFVLFQNRIDYPYKGRTISLNVPFPGNVFTKPFIFLLALIRFKKLVKKENPDWVVSFGKLPNIINILGCKKSVIRGDVYLSLGYKHLLGRIYNLLVKVLFNKAYKIIAVSEGIKEDFQKNFNIKEDKIEVIYNPIDIERIKKLASEKIEFNRKTIISIGRLDRQKGQWHLIRVLKEIENVDLVILGEGELDSYLRNLVKDLNLENRVKFLGWQKNPFKFLAGSDIFVLSSIWEGLSMVILEAMACGVPVISTDCPVGPREIIYPDNGILIPCLEKRLTKAEEKLTEKEERLKREIVNLLNNKELANKLKEKGYKRVEDFSVENIIKKWDFLWK